MEKFKNFLDDFINLAEKTIIELQAKDEAPEDKKEHLDFVLTTFVNVALSQYKVGIVYKFIIMKWVVPAISHIAQRIYDLLTTKFEG
jgi:hypothetical protein